MVIKSRFKRTRPSGLLPVSGHSDEHNTLESCAISGPKGRIGIRLGEHIFSASNPNTGRRLRCQRILVVPRSYCDRIWNNYAVPIASQPQPMAGFAVNHYGHYLTFRFKAFF